jgi:heat shock protein HtpX
VEEKRVRARWGAGSVVSILLCLGAFVGLCWAFETNFSSDFNWWWLLAVPTFVFIWLLLRGGRESDLNSLLAVPADPVRHAEILRMVEDAAQRLGISVPDVFISPVPTANAMASSDTRGGFIVLFQRVIDTFPREETAAIIAHEIAHLKNRDLAYTRFFRAVRTSVVWLFGAMALALAFTAWFVMVLLAILMRTSTAGESRDLGVLTGLAIRLTSGLTKLLVLWGERSRELVADRVAAEILPDPLALARGLRRVQAAERYWDVGDVPEHVSALCIVPPHALDFAARLLSTHPPIETRIRRLEKFVGPSAVASARKAEIQTRQRAEAAERQRADERMRAMVHEARARVPIAITQRVPFEPVSGEQLWDIFEARVVTSRAVRGRTTMEVGDSGRVYVSTHRVVFYGGTRVEWRWARVHDYSWHLDALGGDLVVIAVTTRKSASGLLFDPAAAGPAKRALDLAMAVAEDRREDYVADLIAGHARA